MTPHCWSSTRTSIATRISPASRYFESNWGCDVTRATPTGWPAYSLAYKIM